MRPAVIPPRRLIRRQPLIERIKAYFNPLDFLLWLSEELDTSDWEQWQRNWATPTGVGLNLVMLIARANSGATTHKGDDVFGEEMGGTGWMGWLAAFVVYFLSILSFLNAAYTFYRKRHYRLFETSIDAPPSTPSAHRVRVDSSPLSSSPMRFLANLITTDTAESRAHPDARRDVWELSVWDPTPLCLNMFCMFSPGHVLIYWLFLPTASHDVRPSTTVFTAMVLAALLSVQLSVLRSSFSQQSKDASVIQKEVMNEYDVKYVHPRTQSMMRDVGTQCTDLPNYRQRQLRDSDTVDVYTPVIVVNKGFQTRPNSNYISHVDPEGLRLETPSRHVPHGAVPAHHTPAILSEANLRAFSSPIQPRTAIRQPQFRGKMSTGGGDGGSLGVYTHAQSPLKKSASTNFSGGFRGGEMGSSPLKGPDCPTKRFNVASVLNGVPETQRFAHLQERPGRRESDRFSHLQGRPGRRESDRF